MKNLISSLVEENLILVFPYKTHNKSIIRSYIRPIRYMNILFE